MFVQTIIFLSYVVMVTANKPPTYFPTLPAGEYKLKFKAIFPCESTEHHKLQYNMYLSKTSPTQFKLKGNMTLLIPYDDSINININLAIKSSIGGWKDNAHVYTTTNACSKTKWLYGNLWNDLIKGFNMPSVNCPIKPGVYVTSGIDIEKLMDNNFPKTFYYGEYKMTFTFTNGEKKKLGCLVFVLDFLRPWEV